MFKFKLGAVLVAIVLVAGLLHAQVWEWMMPEHSADLQKTVERKLLGGLQGVYVFMPIGVHGIEVAGLTSRQLEVDAEQKLRLAGIRVLSYEAWERTLGHPTLMVSVYILPPNQKPSTYQKPYTYIVALALFEGASLNRDPTIGVSVPTWQRHEYERTDDLKTIRDTAQDLIDEFINDYLAVNPKEER